MSVLKSEQGARSEVHLKARAAILKFCQFNRFHKPKAVTLTFKKSIIRNNIRFHLDEQRCQQNLRHYLNVVNRKTYGNRVRTGARLRCVPVLEGSSAVDHHYHLLLEQPSGTTDFRFSMLLRQEWHKTDWGHTQVSITDADEGWLRYIMKFRTKSDFLDSIDWINYSQGPAAD